MGLCTSRLWKFAPPPCEVRGQRQAQQVEMVMHHPAGCELHVLTLGRLVNLAMEQKIAVLQAPARGQRQGARPGRRAWLLHGALAGPLGEAETSLPTPRPSKRPP